MSASAQPVAARLAPYYVELRRGQRYAWCACGRSRNQPYCDGSHAGTGIEPLRQTAPATAEVLLCGCKRTGTPPFCDGSHNSLVGVYGTDDPDSPANRAIELIGFGGSGKALVDGGCFVGHVDHAGGVDHADAADAGRWQRHGALAWRTLVGRGDGAHHQALFCFDLPPGHSPPIAFGDRQTALLFTAADAVLAIGSRRFAVRAAAGVEVGASVRPGETFAIENRGATPLRIHVAVGPLADAPLWPSALGEHFDDRYPERIAPVDPAQRHAMAERYFQVLVSHAHGAHDLTQFIGEIPPSKATPHRHLYEETLIVLAGRGMLWTETRKAPVTAGDIIFLPRKQLHSLQCTGPEPMQLVGVIHPGDNPSINYY
ncbi:MAG: CDGSH iron-sulfur domain-containing protein [Lautropia sp.]